jgi:hypothetical protein
MYYSMLALVVDLFLWRGCLCSHSIAFEATKMASSDRRRRPKQQIQWHHLLEYFFLILTEPANAKVRILRGNSLIIDRRQNRI